MRGLRTLAKTSSPTSDKESEKAMSKAYVVTAVDYGETVDGKARTLGVFFDREEAQKRLDEDMEYYKAMHPTYKEGELAVTDDDGNGCEWNVEDIDIRIPLTPLQFTELNLIAQQIADGEEGFASIKDSLSDEEVAYLKDNLKTTYNINIDAMKEEN